jgi:hypothetical protein
MGTSRRRRLWIAVEVSCIAAVAALGCLILARSAPRFNAAEWSDAVPPARFQGGVTAATVVYLDPTEVRSVCGKDQPKPPPWIVILACSDPSKAIVVLPNPCPLAKVEYFARLACHEAAHLKGWRHEP